VKVALRGRGAHLREKVRSRLTGAFAKGGDGQTRTGTPHHEEWIMVTVCISQGRWLLCYAEVLVVAWSNFLLKTE